jgi:predicted protein tyrosine phosphatase
MAKIIRFAKKGFSILNRRIQEQGLKTTLIWAYGRGVPKLTGVPLLQYSEVTPDLFIGAQYNQRGKQHLLNKGIEYDVNLRIEFDDAEHDLALPHYCYLPTIDDDAVSLEHLYQGIAFIKDAHQNGGKVYIHCAGGVGRAPTMGAAYLMSTGLSLDQALEKIRAVRPFISIMPPQMAQLRLLEARLFQVVNSHAII